jgi:hypothetical protein
MKIYQWSVLAVMFAAMSLNAADAASRHNEAGTIGPNGVRQRIAIKLNKTSVGKDVASIQVDLGDHKYPSTKPESWTNPNYTEVDATTGLTVAKYRPVIILTLGTGVVLTATSDAKGKLAGEFKGKQINKGAGLKLDIKKGSLGVLLSELSGNGEHVLLNVLIQENHPPAPVASKSVESRHGHELFLLQMDFDVEENTKTLVARG